MDDLLSTLSTGIPSLDATIQGVLAGDNIVLQTDSLGDFIPFVHRYCLNIHASGQKIIYFRFADHPSFLPDGLDAEIHHLDPAKGFEAFLLAVHRVIEKHGKGGYYLFDCLSGLAVDWYSDRMLGNFFMLACPYLYQFETVTYFVLLRNLHTPLAINAIHETAQVVLDVYRHRDMFYVLPLKAYLRSSRTLYMLHCWDGGVFRPVTESAEISAILSDIPQPWLDVNVDRRDPWTRTFITARAVYDAVKGGKKPAEDPDSLAIRLVRMTLTREDVLFDLCCNYFELGDLLAIGKRMIGTGLIGGKAVGMLLARKILEKDVPEYGTRLETHDSFYIGSDVFYSYIILNGIWHDRYRMKGSAAMYEEADAVAEKLRSGSFPQDIVAQFREVVGYFGQSPLIVRSSSLLEDAYGNAFSGKYESVFCANQGSPEERLASFIDAVRTVYASTASREALSYRSRRGLLSEDEQMAVLVQRVSGGFHGDLYFPHIGGVGYSFNPFVWNDRIDPASGMLRLVFGLGTRAVDRHDDDYTRIAALNEPLLRPEGTSDEARKNSQRIVNVLDLVQNAHVSRSFEDVAASADDVPLEIFTTRDHEMERRAREYGSAQVFSRYLSFEKLLGESEFPRRMQEILQTLEGAYRHPVDIEFTANFTPDGGFAINLLQCRPFQVRTEGTRVELPDEKAARRVILRTRGPVIGQSVIRKIDYIVYVVPEAYSSLPTGERFSVARLLGKIANHPEIDGCLVLMGPGRWGSRMPELGVPVSFHEIRNVSVLCEISRMHEGLNTDLSLGTHFFNDLVDMDIMYLGINEGHEGVVFDRKTLESLPNALSRLVPEAAAQELLVRVVDTRSHGAFYLFADSHEQRALLFDAGTEIPSS